MGDPKAAPESPLTVHSRWKIGPLLRMLARALGNPPPCNSFRAPTLGRRWLIGSKAALDQAAYRLRYRWRVFLTFSPLLYLGPKRGRHSKRHDRVVLALASRRP